MKRQVPRGDEDRFCPMWQKPMADVCHKCPLWCQVSGADPQTGAHRDHWDCAWALLPMLLINTAQETRQGAAAVESFRNEMVDQREAALANITAHMAALNAAKQHAVQRRPAPIIEVNPS